MLFWQTMKTWQAKCTDQYEISNFADLLNLVGSVWSTTTRTWVNDATTDTFSVKCLIY